ncbi:MAG: DMT family transporter [Clostridiales bacterium]|nr:DMT family transporter [Clostridiales bacterium]
MKKKDPRVWGVICVILASMCYGITPILSNTALKGGLPADFLVRVFKKAPAFAVLDPANAMPNESVVGFGMAIACALSFITCLIGRKSLKVTGRQALEMAVFGGGGFTATMLLISYAYLCIPAGTTIVINFTYPLIVALLSAIFFKERLRLPSVLALVIAVFGIALISGVGASGSGALGERPALGIPLALLSGIAYAVYFLAGRHASYNKLDTSAANFWITGSAAVICFVIALASGRFRLPPTGFLRLVLLSSGILGYMIGLRLLLKGIRLLGSAPASALNTLEPVFASAASMLVFGELMTPLKAAGAALVLIGALISILAMRKKPA